jgi:hypothetical protein
VTFPWKPLPEGNVSFKRSFHILQEEIDCEDKCGGVFSVVSVTISLVVPSSSENLSMSRNNATTEL